MDLVSDCGSLCDSAAELEELGGAADGVRNLGVCDQPLLRDLGSQVVDQFDEQLAFALAET